MICPIDDLIKRHMPPGKLTSGHLLSCQMGLVRQSITRARSLSRFYAERLGGVRVDSLTRYRDMEDIPLTYPEDLSSGYKDFLCVPPSHVARIVTLCTSGSTGPSKRICFTTDDLKNTEEFFTAGMSQMVHTKESVAIFMDGPAPYSVGDILRCALTNLNVSPRLCGFIRDMPAAIREAAGCACIIGVPRQILRLARTAPFLRPKTVLLSADYVPSSLISAIERIWGTEVYTHYGMTETGFGGGVQCSAHEGYHMRLSDLLIETVDIATGRQTPPGVYGEVVITALRTAAMPLIRYRTGDMAAIISEPCGCGSELPRLSKVKGRLADISAPISIGDLDEIIYSFDSVLDYEATLSRGSNKLLSITIDAVGSLCTDEVVHAVKANTRYDGDVKVCISPIAVYSGPGKRRLLTSS